MTRNRVDGTVVLGRRVAGRLQEREASFLAAGIAYYAFVSLVPALMLVFAVASFVGGEDLAGAALAASGEVLSPVGQELVGDALAGATGRGPATVVSVLLLAWSTLKVFRGLDVAFSQVYGTEPAPSFVGRVRDAALGLGGAGAGLATLVAVNALVSASGLVLAGVVGTVALVVVLTVALFPLYYLFPDSADPARHALPGAAVAAAGWTVLGVLFRVYAASAGQFSLYGVLGVVLLLVTWYYVGSLALLTGAAVNAVLAGRPDETGTNKNPPADMSRDESA